MSENEIKFELTYGSAIKIVKEYITLNVYNAQDETTKTILGSICSNIDNGAYFYKNHAPTTEEQVVACCVSLYEHHLRFSENSRSQVHQLFLEIPESVLNMSQDCPPRIQPQ